MDVNKRIEYFDIAKAYLILLVIVGHVFIVLNPDYSKIQYILIQSFIYTFHMPAFFVIHGILFQNEKWKQNSIKEFVIKRVHSLIIPYFFFETIGIFFKYLFFDQSVYTGISDMLSIRCNIGADWFLVALFMGSMLFLIYTKHPNKKYAIVSVIGSFLLPMFMSHSQLMIVLGRGLLVYGFIMIGNLAKIFFKSEKNLVVALMITVFISMLSLKFGGNDFYSCRINNPLILAIGGISGTCMVLGISRRFQNTVVSRIGQHTLIIMGTHQLIIYWMTEFFPKIIGGTFIHGLCLLLIILLVEVPIVYLIDDNLSFFTGGAKNV